ALRRSDLIEPEPGSIAGEPVLRFHHALLRDAAYRRLLKDPLAELHTRLAARHEARAPVGPDDEETIGWHLEQAHRHLQELGAIDANGRVVGERAARHPGTGRRRAPGWRSTGARHCWPPARSARRAAPSTSSAASSTAPHACTPGTRASSVS